MGLDKLLRERRDRLNDPAIQAKHAEEWKRVEKSFGNLGDQTKETATGLIYHSLMALSKAMIGLAGLGHGSHGKDKKDKKSKHGGEKGKEAIGHGVEVATTLLVLVGRILMTAGRTTKYGVRKGLAI